MNDYGERVQFSLSVSGPQPCYQVLNTSNKAMAFDRQHHLLHPVSDEFVGVNGSKIFSLEQVKSVITGVSIRITAAKRTTRSTAIVKTAAVKKDDASAAERYAYYRDHRDLLPEGISAYSGDIAALMKTGKTAEQAFGEICDLHF